ncbi:hypothetical protein D9611_007464 [Ephemerocybe angulata]|uniref:Uncharacterized protein n=1 Tax=Ephemerocybe angulata TaxID=980116 RepID=A0A8H5CGX6_9AGAR|nr:hypothetical protein D9611_007464 [Tulosesus angulatus]
MPATRPSDVSLPAPNHISSNGYAPNHISNGYANQYISYNWPYSYPHANHVVPPPLANDAGWESTPPTNHVVSNTSHLGRSSSTVNNLPTQPFGLYPPSQPQYPRSTESHAQSFGNFHSVPYPYPNSSPISYYQNHPDPYTSPSYGHYPPQPILRTPPYPWVTPPLEPATFVQITPKPVPQPTQPATFAQTTPEPAPQPPSITIQQARVLVEEINRLNAENVELRRRLRQATTTAPGDATLHPPRASAVPSTAAPAALANQPSSTTPPTSTLSPATTTGAAPALPPPRTFNFGTSASPGVSRNKPQASAVPATAAPATLANPTSFTIPPLLSATLTGAASALPPPAIFPRPIQPFESSRVRGYVPQYDDSDSDSDSSYFAKRSPTTVNTSFNFYEVHNDPNNNNGYNEYDDEDCQAYTTDDEQHEDDTGTTSPDPCNHDYCNCLVPSYDDSDGHQSEGQDYSDDDPNEHSDENADYEYDNPDPCDHSDYCNCLIRSYDDSDGHQSEGQHYSDDDPNYGDSDGHQSEGQDYSDDDPNDNSDENDKSDSQSSFEDS